MSASLTHRLDWHHRLVLFLLAAMLAALVASQAAASCEGAASYSEARGGLALLIMKEGEVVCERYVGEFTRDTPHTLFSGTKSFMGVIAAAAVADGFLSLDEPVSDTLTEWHAEPARTRITIRHLLSLTSGIDTQPPSWAEPFAVAAERGVKHQPGEVFEYGPTVFQVFGEVMRRKLLARGQGGDVTGYFKARVLDPLGIELEGFIPAVGEEDPNFAAGAMMSAANWARYGEAIRKGDDTIATANLDEATFEAQFEGTEANPAYGLGWWLARPVDPARKADLGRPMITIDLPEGAAAGAIPGDVAAALGAGGQMLFVSREAGLVIVRFAPRPQPGQLGGGFSHTAFLEEILAIPVP